MITLRSNQSEPINKAIAFFNEKKPKPSLIVLPTAWGKSILTAFVAKNCTDKLLVLQPSKELLEQNYKKYLSLCGFVTNAGIYSASFGRKDIAQITYATIGSIKSLGATFKQMGFTKMLIDEAHLYPRESDSMLGKFLEESGITHVLGISTASIALYYQIIGRATRIDEGKQDALIIDLGGNVARFGKVEDITFERGKIWRMFGSGGKLLSGIPISDIGRVTKQDVDAMDAGRKAVIEVMPFGKYKGERIADIPASYRQWCLANFEWKAHNENLRQSLLATLKN